MSFSRPNQWQHSHADLIWPDGTFNLFARFYSKEKINIEVVGKKSSNIYTHKYATLKFKKCKTLYQSVLCYLWTSAALIRKYLTLFTSPVKRQIIKVNLRFFAVL